MAVVYVARAHGVGGFERLVALKVLHANLAYEDEFIKMFLDEARLAARIRHPNVVPTTDISDTIETGFYLVMDYIEGDHLGAMLSGAYKAGERLPVPVALRIVVDTLNGLGAAHDLRDEHGQHLKLVHRDVSPHNVMVGRDGVARLTDFGVAKAEDRLTHTRDGQVKGKLAYMPPEQASTGKGDSRGDLFSAGTILWEALTGRRLFRGETTASTLHKLLHDEIPAPSSVVPELAPLDAVVLKALERDPDRRYATAEEFVMAVEEAASQVGGLASLRAVSRAVEKFASAKLERDRKTINSAKAMLARQAEGTGPFELDSVSEPSMPSELSLSASSRSFSKLSGVYSSATSAGMGVRASQPGLAPVVAPPPALGALDPSYAAQRKAAQRKSARRLPLVITGILGVVVLGLLGYLMVADAPGLTVESMAPSSQPAAPQQAEKETVTESVSAEPKALLKEPAELEAEDLAAPEPETQSAAKVEPMPAPAKPTSAAGKKERTARRPAARRETGTAAKSESRKATGQPKETEATASEPPAAPAPKNKSLDALLRNPYQR